MVFRQAFLSMFCLLLAAKSFCQDKIAPVSPILTKELPRENRVNYVDTISNVKLKKLSQELDSILNGQGEKVNSLFIGVNSELRFTKSSCSEIRFEDSVSGASGRIILSFLEANFNCKVWKSRKRSLILRVRFEVYFVAEESVLYLKVYSSDARHMYSVFSAKIDQNTEHLEDSL